MVAVTNRKSTVCQTAEVFDLDWSILQVTIVANASAAGEMSDGWFMTYMQLRQYQLSVSGEVAAVRKIKSLEV